MLKEKGPQPTGRWADLGVLQPVRDYKARHTSTLLVFDAVERALEEIARAKTASKSEPAASAPAGR
jgi:NifU-like protein involved in Fe-S cluster formation